MCFIVIDTDWKANTHLKSKTNTLINFVKSKLNGMLKLISVSCKNTMIQLIHCLFSPISFFLFAIGISVNWNMHFGRLVFSLLCSTKFTYSRSSCAGQTQSRIVLQRYKIECNYGFLWLLQLLQLHSINKIGWSFVCHLSFAQITSWKVVIVCTSFG